MAVSSNARKVVKKTGGYKTVVVKNQSVTLKRILPKGNPSFHPGNVKIRG